MEKDNFTRIDNDINGNPRYYLPIYLLDELTHKEINQCGGVKYRGKKYGPGYVFTSYNINDTIKILSHKIAQSMINFSK